MSVFWYFQSSYPLVLFFAHFPDFILQARITNRFSPYMISHIRFQCLSSDNCCSSILNRVWLVSSLYSLTQLHKMEYIQFLVVFSFEGNLVREKYSQKVELLWLLSGCFVNHRCFESFQMYSLCMVDRL